MEHGVATVLRVLLKPIDGVLLRIVIVKIIELELELEASRIYCTDVMTLSLSADQ